MLDKKQMKYLSVLADCKSISRASELLFTSQPSVSRYLKTLEDDLGFQIFNRSTTPFKLTEKGKIYIRYLDKFLQLESEMYDELSNVKENKNTIRISGLSFLSSYVYPSFIPEFIKNNPDIPLIIKDFKEENCEYLLLNNLVDIFITNFPPKHKSLNYKLVKKDYIFIVCKANNHLKNKYKITSNSIENPILVDFNDLKCMTFYLLNQTENVGIISKKILEHNNFTPKKIIYIPNIVSAVSMINYENSATFITKSSLTYAKLKGDFFIFKLNTHDNLLSIGFIYRKDIDESLVNLVYKSLCSSLK